MQTRRWTVLAAAASAVLLAPAVLADPYPVKGQVVQVLESFDNPEGAIFSADGRFVLVSNAAELGMPDKGFHWTEKAGYVSKLAVQPDGTLKMVTERLVTGVTAPLGMAVNPVATAKFPKGSRLDTEIVKTNSVIVTPPYGEPMTLVFDKEKKLSGPADIAVRKLSDGSWLLVIPELSAVSANNKNNPVTVVKLPAGFDRF